jgi:FkbM family methyltransferase
MKAIRKIKEKYKQFKIHPITKGNEFKGLYRYISFNIKNKFINEIHYNWIEGLQFVASKGDAGIVGNIYFGLYEFDESIFLLHFMEKEDLFLDVGANVGHYSLLLSGLKRCKSIAIEPVPKQYNQLQKLLNLNRLETLIDARNIGISNAEGTLYFSTDRSTMDRVVSEKYKNSVSVGVVTIDSIFSDVFPIAIKIDVEGYEKYALDGASKTLQNENVKVIILELNQSGLKYGFDDSIIYKTILGYGFRPFSYNPVHRKLIQLESYNTHQFNTIFVKDENFVANRLLKSRKISIRGINI